MSALKLSQYSPCFYIGRKSLKINHEYSIYYPVNPIDQHVAALRWYSSKNLSLMNGDIFCISLISRVIAVRYYLASLKKKNAYNYPLIDLSPVAEALIDPAHRLYET